MDFTHLVLARSIERGSPTSSCIHRHFCKPRYYRSAFRGLSDMIEMRPKLSSLIIDSNVSSEPAPTRNLERERCGRTIDRFYSGCLDEETCSFVYVSLISPSRAREG